MSFIDLSKAHESVGGKLLCKIRPRFSVPHKMIEAVRFYTIP